MTARLGRAWAHAMVLTLRIRLGRNRKLFRDPKMTYNKLVNFQPSDPRPAHGQASNGDRTDGYGAEHKCTHCNGTKSLGAGRNCRECTRAFNTMAPHWIMTIRDLAMRRSLHTSALEVRPNVQGNRPSRRKRSGAGKGPR